MRQVVAVALALLVGQPGAAASARPVPVFNVPSGSAWQQDAISRHVGALIAAAPPGSLIRIAIFRFTSPEFASALVAAKRRGVRVRLVVDAGSQGTAAYRRVVAALGTVRGRTSWIVACRRGCVGDTLMHNKFFLFSRTGRERDVVVQSSANLTTADRTQAWNNAVTLRDPRIYRAYGRYFAALAARRGPAGQVTRSGPVTLNTFPAAGDPLDESLGRVRCAGGTPVHVAVFRFTRVAVARRLRSLARQGCDVRVVYTHLGERVRPFLAHARLLSGRYRYGRSAKAFVHSKYVAIGGRHPAVVTGSPNITMPGLRHNDEAMLTIEDAAVHRAYEGDFARLWRTAGGR